MKYALKSKTNKRYLSAISEEEHDKQFNEYAFSNSLCYTYKVKQIAEDVALQMGAVVVPVMA